jgi:hypothetical protein
MLFGAHVRGPASVVKMRAYPPAHTPFGVLGSRAVGERELSRSLRLKESDGIAIWVLEPG